MALGLLSVRLPDRPLCPVRRGHADHRHLGAERARRHRQRASHRRRRWPAGPAGGCHRRRTIGRTVGRTVAPIDDLVAAAARIERGDYSVRVRERGTRPVRSLARAFNGMSAPPRGPRPAAADIPGRRGARTAHATVRDRRPARGIEDGALPGGRRAPRAHPRPVKALDKLIDDLRTVALAEAGSLPLNRRPTDLAALIDEAVSAFAGQPTTPASRSAPTSKLACPASTSTPAASGR